MSEAEVKAKNVAIAVWRGRLTSSTGHISVSNSSYTIGPSFVGDASPPSMVDIHLRREGRVKDVTQVLTLGCIVLVAAAHGLADLVLSGELPIGGRELARAAIALSEQSS
jgi:hypothetical protein